MKPPAARFVKVKCLDSAAQRRDSVTSSQARRNPEPSRTAPRKKKHTQLAMVYAHVKLILNWWKLCVWCCSNPLAFTRYRTAVCLRSKILRVWLFSAPRRRQCVGYMLYYLFRFSAQVGQKEPCVRVCWLIVNPPSICGSGASNDEGDDKIRLPRINIPFVESNRKHSGQQPRRWLMDNPYPNPYTFWSCVVMWGVSISHILHILRTHTHTLNIACDTKTNIPSRFI